LIGSYLTQIGLAENAVVYITQAAPNEMTWLTLRAAAQIGIEVMPWERYLQRKVTLEQPGATSQSSPDQEVNRRAKLFVTEINSRWSATNEVDWLGPLYADEVNFHGKRMSRGEVITAQRLFAERWPERNYKPQDKSMNAVCSESGPGQQEVAPLECIVTGTATWATRSLARNVTASGLMSFSYVLRASGGAFFIKGETSRVLQRDTRTAN